MSWINNMKSYLAFLVSLILSFAVAESVYRYSLSEEKRYQYKTMFFESPNIINLYDNYFTYKQNEKIRSVTLFSTREPSHEDDLTIEYDYIIETNNAGLVMKRDIKKHLESIFVIGDSFTEGQGAVPWFYDFENQKKENSHQLVNLGLMGTGPEQWLNIFDATLAKFQLVNQGIIINIIPSDIDRELMLFSDRELRCLEQLVCDYIYGFQGYEFKTSESYNDMKQHVINSSNKFYKNSTSTVQMAKDFMKSSKLIHHTYLSILQIKRLKSVRDRINRNLVALEQLILKNPDKVFVNILAQKDINSENYHKSSLANQLVDFLEARDIEYLWCDIPKSGFHLNDGHPNSFGYEVVKTCTAAALGRISN